MGGQKGEGGGGRGGWAVAARGRGVLARVLEKNIGLREHGCAAKLIHVRWRPQVEEVELSAARCGVRGDGRVGKPAEEEEEEEEEEEAV